MKVKDYIFVIFSSLWQVKQKLYKITVLLACIEACAKLAEQNSLRIVATTRLDGVKYRYATIVS
jgi:hypothetical protein